MQSRNSFDPIIKTNGGGNCKISMTPIRSNRSMVGINLSGFEPEENFIFQSKSAHEVGSGKWKADKNGNTTITLMPHVKGLSRGKENFEAQGSNCFMSITFDWWV